MKQLFILVGFVCLIAVLLPACAPAPEPEPEPEVDAAPAKPQVDLQAEDEAAIREVMEQADVFMNKLDAKAYAALFDQIYENWTGSIKGRAALEKDNAESFKNQKTGQYTAGDEIGLIFVTPDVAIFKEHGELSGFVDENGKTYRDNIPLDAGCDCPIWA